jgi:hypothetical protein
LQSAQLINMCFEVITDIVTGQRTGRKFVVIDGIRYSPDVKIGDLIQLLDYIAKHRGEKAFQQNVAALLKQLRPATQDILKRLKYGVRLLRVNYDVYNQFGEIIFKGPVKYMRNFLAYSDIPTLELKRLRLSQVVDDFKEELELFGFDREAFQKVTGLDYPDEIRRGFGYAPDFDLTDEFIKDFIYLGDRKNANIVIKMSGNYDEDFKRANEVAGILASDLAGGSAPPGFVWHHLDDVDFDEAGEAICTMQLVRQELHSKVIKAPEDWGVINHGTEHAGACAIWKRFFDIVGYNY